MTGPVGVMVSPQSLSTVGGVGVVMAEAQATVAAPFAGTVKSLRSMVYTKLQGTLLPEQSV